MIIFYGLGNNDPKYLQTKHNVGRLVLEGLSKNLDLQWQDKNSFSYIKTTINQTPVYFVLSKGYMNNSGLPLVDLCHFFKLKFESLQDKLFIIHDDSDQQVGKQKLALAGGSAGHRGIDSIYSHLSGIGLTKESIWRVKIGIRPEQNTQKSETFVLKSLSQQDLFAIKEVVRLCTEKFSEFFAPDLSRLQTHINTPLTSV